MNLATDCQASSNNKTQVNENNGKKNDEGKKEENQELSNDLILVKYFQFREEEFSARGGIGAHTAETNVLGEILYQFLNDLELSEFD